MSRRTLQRCLQLAATGALFGTLLGNGSGSTTSSSDGCFRFNFFSPSTARDSDGDGFSDSAESSAGTDPGDTGSYPGHP